MIVVDIGCCPHEGDLSVDLLVERYSPILLYGFDPLLPFDETYELARTKVIVSRKAAWTYNGRLRLGVGAPSLLDVTPMREKDDRGEWGRHASCTCFDFAAWLRAIGPAVVKVNIEGGEFPLLEHLVAEGADELIVELLVQWHDERMGGDFPERRHQIERSLRCPVEEWKIPQPA